MTRQRLKWAEEIVDVLSDASGHFRENKGGVKGFEKVHISLWNESFFFFFYLGFVRSPHVQRFDRVADGHVPVHTHHCQGEGAGEHVVVVDRHHCLAQSVPKWPEAEKHVCALRNIQKSENEHGNTAGGRTENSISSEIWLWTVSYSMRWKQIRAAKHETITPDNQPVTDESPYNIQMLAEIAWTTTVFQGTLLNVHSTRWRRMWIKNREVKMCVKWKMEWGEFKQIWVACFLVLRSLFIFDKTKMPFLI